MKRTDMINIKDILRHRYELDLSRDEIAAAIGVSAGTVSNVLKRAAAARLSSWPLADDLDDEALRAQLYPRNERDSETVQPDWDALIEAYTAPRGRRRARLTRRQLWIEYRDEVRAQGGAAYSYSRFCALLKGQLAGRHAPTQMRFDYAPGLYGMSDFSGKTLPVHTATGVVDVEIFVAVLPHSTLIYAEALPDQTICHWTMAHRRALEYFGASPGRWIIDNLKSGVTKADREEPHLNPSFREFAKHYGLAILPARPKKPTDKGPAEAAVKAVQCRILLPLRHETFFSIGAMNAAIRRELEQLNTTPMAKGESRRAVFEAHERATLVPLPAHPWEWGAWHSRKVAPNGHVAFDRNHYSVPEGHIGRDVEVRVGERMIEVFLDRGGERIAVHRLKSGRNQYATHPDHMPDRLKAVRDIRSPDYGDILLARARRIGANALAWAERCMASRDFPEQAYTAVQGMSRLAETHGDKRVDAVCAQALSLNRLASGYLRERLKKGGKAVVRPEPQETIPSHANLRGPTYYAKNQGEKP
ncbi:IS21 family transposase [Nitratireductor sp. XY-223]|uniref:IS21 family transposase n=1 Tax=Nitratireductor sp. XY-223 TaxID=2561926 RepID=UPI00145A34E9|nr:IS21 family transposase [Nitratireductor sp. XY-223]